MSTAYKALETDTHASRQSKVKPCQWPRSADNEKADKAEFLGIPYSILFFLKNYSFSKPVSGKEQHQNKMVLFIHISQSALIDYLHQVSFPLLKTKSLLLNKLETQRHPNLLVTDISELYIIIV